ncbi:MAG: DUF6883 domain-containing protein [Solirubrobacteraceae bacterium]
MTPNEPWPPRVGEPLPRGEKAYTAPEKLAWILSAAGHGREWARVLHIGGDDTQRFWEAIAQAVLDEPIFTVRDREPKGIACGVDIELTIGKRSIKARTSWHYESPGDAPRLVTAYPKL